MIGAAWLVAGVALGSEPPIARARAQLLLAAWAEAHGDRLTAERAAAAVLLHDAGAVPPRVLQARLREGEPGGTPERLRRLEEAAALPGADAATWTALGRARAASGDADGASAAYAVSDVLGPSSPNFAAWLGLLEAGWSPPSAAPGGAALAGPVLADELTRRWFALGDPGPGGHALRATWADSPARGVDAAACADADAATRLGEAVAPLVVVRRCGAAGRIRTAQRALDRLKLRVLPAELAEARTHLARAAESTTDEMSSLRLLGYPARAPDTAAVCPWLGERWPDEPALRTACVRLGGWPP